jgi:hypothetical protein
MGTKDMIYNKICLMLPTYGRCKTYLPKFLDSAEKTATSICFSLCVNKKDLATINYLDERVWKFDYEVIFEETEKPHLAKYFNLLYGKSKWKKDGSTVVSMVGDDMEFLTPNWDKKMLDLINKYNGVGVFWGDDDFIARERLCVNMFVTRYFVDATEHPFMCELFAAEMIDYLWYKVGKYTRTLHFDPNIIIKHNHMYKQENKDETFKRLEPMRKVAWDGGKIKAKDVAAKIAGILKAKGMVGNSIC